MSRLLEIQEKLQDTSAALAQIEREVATSPPSSMLGLMADSILKRQKRLEAEFREAVNTAGIEICTYRLFAENQQPTLIGIANALIDFQSMFTVVYDARKNGRKFTAKVAPDIAAACSFGIAYTFSGSVGIVLSISGRQNLIGGTDFDETIDTIFEMAAAKTSEEILGFSRKLGPAPIRLLNQWATDLVRNGLGVEVKWQHDRKCPPSLLMQHQEMSSLSKTIAQTSDKSVSSCESTGMLLGADVLRASFHFLTDAGQEIRGTFRDAISDKQTVELPKRYAAYLTVTRQIQFATEVQSETFFLDRLESVKQ